jgi:ubiquinone/menaquinone biosynthesis C-methylase UbiE
MTDPRHVRLSELLVGVEGLALLRHLYDGSDQEADRRLAEVRRILDGKEFATAEPMIEAEPRAGYGSWSERYDEPGNPIIALEEQVVWSLLDAAAAGHALDAACGTGRHARHLASRGHRVVGIDVTPDMLARARAQVQGVEFIEGDLLRLPAEAGRFQLVVCGLALAHVADLAAAVAELARVLSVGGGLVISVLHPFLALLGWHAPFEDAQGRRGFVREHPHTHSDYLDAFSAAGLEMRRCIEPALTAEHVSAKKRAFRHVREAALAAYVGLPGVVVWQLDKK